MIAGYRPKIVLRHGSLSVRATSGSRTSETGGGQIFAKIFEPPFFRRFPKKFQHFPQKCHPSPKISDDFFFLIIDLFHVLMCYFSVGGAESVADIDRGGQNPYISTNSQCYHYSFCSRGGANSIANFDGGPWPDLPPLDPPLVRALSYCVGTLSKSLTHVWSAVVCCNLHHRGECTSELCVRKEKGC